ncbi:putative alpha beta hydrolase fold family protein [Rosellinia necatrix]|uniref:Putative alpha beta hydrolase fold family protein n=1 Tax=Rosellinia necatrix TaxID=77044 RepID=A0A1S7ULN5_ROSNE|nr:putative alpha beta hydrolase fold family protein [Rosellinia necatrix]
MIGNSLPEYVFIRISIFLLQYTTPICLAYLAILSTINGLESVSSWTGRVAIGYSILDILYAIFIYYPYNRRLKWPAQHPPLRPRAERWALFIRCLDNVPDTASYLQAWFLGADKADIREDNVREFFSWAFFDRLPGNETAEELEELDEYVAEVQRRIDYQLEPGRGKAKSLRLTLDEIEVRYRSIAWYIIIAIVDLGTHFLLSYRGFRFHAQPESPSYSVVPLRIQSLSFFAKKRSVSQLSYWYRPHTAKDKLPLVFLHGIGIGLWPYTLCLSNINAAFAEDDQIGIIALEYLPVSTRLTNPPLSQPEFLAQIALLLDMHGWDKFAVLGHSYGTALATHMLKSPSLNPRIQSVVLVDPVCILLHLPHVAYNFTRRKPRRANEYLLWYFASMDPGVAHCLGRHFFWKDNIAWKEDLLRILEEPSANGEINRIARPGGPRRRRVTVCLAERDLIVDTKTVLQYLLNDEDWISEGAISENSFISIQQPSVGLEGDHFEHNGIEVAWFDGLDHAQAFDKKEASRRLAAITRQSCTPC